MAKRRVSNLLALAVLACVAERAMHPYEISTTLRTRGKDQSIKVNYGSLYSVVESLAKHGLIEAQESVKDGKRPERTIYTITSAGRAEMEDWLAELLASPTKEYTSFEAALSLVAGVAPDEVVRLLRTRCARLEMELGAIDGALAYTRQISLPELFVVEEQYRRAMVQAELAFVTDLAHRIESDKLGGTPGWRRMHELAEQGVSLAEVLADPLKHLGKDGEALAPFLDRQ